MHIINAHCHIYPDAIAQRASAAIGAFYQFPMEADGRVETLLHLGDEAGVCHHIVCGVATTPHQVASIHRFLADTIVRYPGRFTGLGALHHESANIEEDIAQAISLGLRGFKVHPDIQGVAVDDERLMNAYALLEGKLPVLFHCGDTRYDLSNPNRVRRVLEAFPNLTVIGAHLGGWSLWKEAVSQLGQFPNFFVDTSSSLFALSPEEAASIIRQYGSERVLFGVDYPMWTPAGELQRFFALPLTEKEKERILSTNASNLFGIKL